MVDKVTKSLTAAEIEAIKNGKVADNSGDDEVEFIDEMPPQEKVHPLRYPMRFKGTDYRHVTVRPFTGRDFITMRRMSMLHGEEIGMIAAITDAPVPVIKKMSGEDFMAILNVVKDFLPQQLQAEGADEQTGENGLSTSPSSPASSEDGGETTS